MLAQGFIVTGGAERVGVDYVSQLHHGGGQGRQAGGEAEENQDARGALKRSAPPVQLGGGVLGL